MSKRKGLRVAFVGTESLRAKELRNVLSKKRFPLKNIEFYDPAVQEEYSKLTQFREEPKVIHHLDKELLEGVDLVFLASDKKVNQELGALASSRKFQAIDLCETFNKDKNVPVVVAGVNDEIIDREEPSLIANPHPATVFLSHIFHLVHRSFVLKKAVAVILQPVSAFEESGIEELANQSYSLLSSSSLTKKVFKEQIAFNLLSQTEKADKDGFTAAEKQITSEIHRVLASKDILFSLSLIQAPIFYTYSIMTYLELGKKTDVEGLKGLFWSHPLFRISLEGQSSPVSVAGKEKIFIGQIKKEESAPDRFWIWTVADNLTRGSALNALEIAEKIFFKQSA